MQLSYAITNSKAVREDIHKDFVKIMGEGGETNCGGTLINPRWVLTAAHCVTNRETYQNLPANTIYIQMDASKGTLQASKSQIITRWVQKIEVPVKVFKDGNYKANDIALLKLYHPINDITPITLNQNNYSLVGRV